MRQAGASGIRRPLASLVLACAMVLLLPGCLAQRVVFGGPHVHDLAFEEVALVDLRDRPEVLAERARWTSDPAIIGRSEPSLMVALSTATDLGRFNARYGYTVWPRVGVCAAGGIDLQRLLTDGGAFDAVGRLFFAGFTSRAARWAASALDFH